MNHVDPESISSESLNEDLLEALSAAELKEDYRYFNLDTYNNIPVEDESAAPVPPLPPVSQPLPKPYRFFDWKRPRFPKVTLAQKRARYHMLDDPLM